VTGLDDLIERWAELLGLGQAAGLAIRLILAALAGGLVGFEREMRGRQAGFRTHMLVCVGSALVMIVSAQVALVPWRPPGGGGVNLQVDPSRIAYGVMTGVGFLGAGAIVKEGMTIRGLTTAAALWCVAAIGLAAGLGLYVIAVLATALVLLVLWALGLLENYLPKKVFRVIVVRRKWAPGCIVNTINRIQKHGVSAHSTSFKRIEDLSTVDISVRIAYTKKLSYATLERELLEADEDFQVISAGELEN
jgi:putative Mg2+ transporter-C (MgtC) family protein